MPGRLQLPLFDAGGKENLVNNYIIVRKCSNSYVQCKDDILQAKSMIMLPSMIRYAGLADQQQAAV
jgi:hypothetical protein